MRFAGSDRKHCDPNFLSFFILFISGARANGGDHAWLHSTGATPDATSPLARFVVDKLTCPRLSSAHASRTSPPSGATAYAHGVPRPKRPHACMPPADEAAHVAHGARETPLTYERTRSAEEGDNGVAHLLRSVGSRADNAAPGRRRRQDAKRAESPPGKHAVFFLPRSHQLRPRAARAPPSETAAGGDPVQCASHSFFIES
jgi:hypothetical protein